MLTAFTSMLALAAAVQADTTFAVSPDDRLSINHHAGSIEVLMWDRNEVRITSEDDDDSAIQVDRRGSEIRVTRHGRHATHSSDYTIMVPDWLPLAIGGINTDVTVTGTRASIRGGVVNGDFWVRGGQGLVSISTTNGDVTVEGSSGRVHVVSVDGDVSVTDVTGSVKAVTVDGDVTLERVDSRSVDASTVDGDVYHSGPVYDDGRYRLTTHDGDVTFFLPDNVNATVSVSTFSGEFESDFPFTISRLGGTSKRFSFTLGSGSAEVILEAFDGSIELRRSGGN